MNNSSKIKKQCIIPGCSHDGERNVVLEKEKYLTKIGKPISEEFYGDKQWLCLQHRLLYNQKEETCIVCNRKLRGARKKRKAKPWEKRRIMEVLENNRIPVPQDFLSAKLEICTACIANPAKRIKTTADFGKDDTLESFQKDDVPETDDTAQEITYSGDNNVLEEIRKQAVKNTLKILKDKLKEDKIAKLNNIHKIYSEMIENLADERSYNRKIFKKKSGWLRLALIEENVAQGNSPLELSFFFISKKESSLIINTSENIMQLINSLIEKNHQTDDSNDEDCMIEQINNPLSISLTENSPLFIFNFAKNLNESLKNTIKNIKQKWSGKPIDVSQTTLNELISSIDNNLFNFVLLLTLDGEEFKKIQQIEIDWHNPGWILTHTDLQSVKSYKKLIRRIFICFIMAFTLDPSCQTPLHISLTDYVHKYSGSLELIKVLNQCGVCINQDSFRKFRTKVVSEQRESGSFGTPMNLTMETFGIISGDNYDKGFQNSNVRDDLGYSKSLHLLGTMLTFPNSKVNYPANLLEAGRPLNPQKTNICDKENLGDKNKPKRLKTEPILVPEYPSPSPIEKVTSKRIWLEKTVNEKHLSMPSPWDEHFQNVNEKILTLCWQKSNHSIHECSSVTPCLKVSLKSQGFRSPIATTCCFTMINSPPDTKKTVKVWLDLLYTHVVQKYGLKKLIVLGDGKTFGLITEIIFDYPEVYSWVLPYLGEFHRNAVYMRALNKLYDGVGLDTLAKATYGGSTLTAVLKVSHYRKALDFLLNVLDALVIIQIKAFIRYLEEVNPIKTHVKTINDLKTSHNKCISLSKISSDDSHRQYCNALSCIKKLMPIFKEFLEWGTKRSNSFHVWKNFVWSDMSTLICSLESIASGDWDLNVASSKMMIPLFFALDCTNYKRWSILDIVEKEDYPTEIKQIFKSEGCWKMAVSARKNAAMPGDMAHECFCNKPMKSAVHSNKTDLDLMELEIHYLPYRANLTKNLEILLQGKEQRSLDKINPEESKRNNKEVSKYLSILENSDIFDEIFTHNDDQPSKLKALRGIEANVELENSLLNARKIGIESYNKFVDERLLTKSISIKEKIPKTNLTVFPSILEGKKTQKKRIKDSSCIEHHRLIKLVEVSRERNIDLEKIGTYMLSEDSALSVEKGTKPFLGQSKASVVNDYLKVKFPNSFKTDRPTANCVVMDGENLIFVGKQQPRITFEKQITNMFLHMVLWRFNLCEKLKIAFDQHGFEEDTGEKLKEATKIKRYYEDPMKTYPIIDVSEKAIVPDNWESITHNPENRRKYKDLLGKLLLSDQILCLIPRNKEMVINGLYEYGKSYSVNTFTEDPSIKEETELKYSEADIKMFMMSEINCINLIVSLDTDVIFIGLLNQIKHSDSTRYFIEMGKTMKHYVDITSLIHEISLVYCDISKLSAVSSIVTLYAATGCDFSPYFRNLRKPSLFLLNESENSGGMKTEGDFTRLLIRAYENRYSGITYSNKCQDPQSDVSRLRMDLFSRKSSEPSTIPIFSVINLQYLRSKFIYNYWQNTIGDKTMINYGWEKSSDEKIKIKLVDTNDNLYSYPRNIIKGCSCKKGCKSRCSCNQRNGCHKKCCSCLCVAQTKKSGNPDNERSLSIEETHEEDDNDDFESSEEEFINTSDDEDSFELDVDDLLNDDEDVY